MSVNRLDLSFTDIDNSFTDIGKSRYLMISIIRLRIQVHIDLPRSD